MSVVWEPEGEVAGTLKKETFRRLYEKKHSRYEELGSRLSFVRNFGVVCWITSGWTVKNK